MASPTSGPVWAKLALPLPARKVFCPAADPVTVLIPLISSGPPLANPLTVAGVVDRSIVTPGTPDVAAEKSAALPLPVASNVYPPVAPDTKVVFPVARPSNTWIPAKGSVTVPSTALPVEPPGTPLHGPVLNPDAHTSSGPPGANA